MVLAHSSHWLANAVYSAPVLIVLAALLVDRARHRGVAAPDDVPISSLDDVMDGRS